MEKLKGIDLYRKVTELGEIDKKQKAALCGYADSYVEFLEAWIEASTAALGLNYTEGSIIVEANSLTGTEGHQGFLIGAEELYALFGTTSDIELNNKIEFCCTFYSEDSKPEIKAVLISAEADGGSSLPWLLYRHMSRGDDVVIIVHTYETTISTIQIEIEENQSWSFWDLDKSDHSLPLTDCVRLTSFDRATGEEISYEEIYELPDLPLDVSATLFSMMNIGPAFKWDSELESYTTRLNSQYMTQMTTSIDADLDCTFYSNGFNRSNLDLLSIARPSSSIRTWFPH